MSPANAVALGVGSPKRVGVRARAAIRKDHFYVRLSKLWTQLAPGGSRKILFSDKPDWESAIRNGFRGLPHEIEFGAITEESFRRFDIVVPLTLGALDDARRCCPLDTCAYPLPSAESVRLCHDKYEFNEKVAEAGFSRYIPRTLQGLGLPRPYILKKRVGSWGQDCFVIRSEEDENSRLALITRPDYFCQELIPGNTEFATHILIRGGRIVKALNVRYEFAIDSPIKGQDTANLQTVCRSRHLDLWRTILRRIHFEGLCCVNYKDVDGEPFLLEINPRFGGSLNRYFFSFVKHLRA